MKMSADKEGIELFASLGFFEPEKQHITILSWVLHSFVWTGQTLFLGH